MEKTTLPDPERLNRLREEARTVTDAIADIERELERWLPQMDGVVEPKNIIAFLQTRHALLREHEFNLGKVTARAEGLEQRIPSRDESRAEQAFVSTSDFLSPVYEDHLDWLDLDEPRGDEPNLDRTQEPERGRG